MAHEDGSDQHQQTAEPFRHGSIDTSDTEIEKAVQHLGTPDPHPHATLSVETTHMGDPSPLYVAGVRESMSPNAAQTSDLPTESTARALARDPIDPTATTTSLTRTAITTKSQRPNRNHR